MSYTIYYGRRAIKMDEGKYIVLEQIGDNNVWEYSENGKQVPDKNWSVVHVPKRFEDIAHLSGKWIFDKNELCEIARYAEEHFEMFKARHTRFAENEYCNRLSRVGMAKTVEEYKRRGNRLIFLEGDWENPTRTYVQDTKHLRRLHDEKVRGSDAYHRLIFDRRDLLMTKVKRSEKKPYAQDHFFMIQDRHGRGLVKLHGKSGYRHTYTQDPALVKKFKTLKEAEAYRQKYEERLKEFKVIRIDRLAEF